MPSPAGQRLGQRRVLARMVGNRHAGHGRVPGLAHGGHAGGDAARVAQDAAAGGVDQVGGAQRGTVLAAALLCSAFTAFTGGSGVTILALGGLLLQPRLALTQWLLLSMQPWQPVALGPVGHLHPGR